MVNINRDCHAINTPWKLISSSYIHVVYHRLANFNQYRYTTSSYKNINNNNNNNERTSHTQDDILISSGGKAKTVGNKQCTCIALTTSQSKTNKTNKMRTDKRHHHIRFRPSFRNVHGDDCDVMPSLATP